MTILEMNIYNTLLAMEAEKALAGIEPHHTLVVRDNLLDRVKARIGMEVARVELDNALHRLAADGRIVIGNTINDNYAKVIYRDLTNNL